jgi:hypothetical protein
MNVYDKVKSTCKAERKSSYPDQERTDFHMQYLRLDDKGLWTSKNTGGKLAMQILVSPASYEEAKTNLLLEGGIKNIEDGTVDIALSSVRQFKGFSERQSEMTTHIDTTIANNYVLLWKKDTKNPEIIKNVVMLKDRIDHINDSSKM